MKMENQVNILVSCIYRAPGSDMDKFKTCIEKMYSKTDQNNIFICGDFNIDLDRSQNCINKLKNSWI